jgi:hypothetical protein
MRRIIVLGLMLLAFSCSSQENAQQADIKDAASTAKETGVQPETASTAGQMHTGPVVLLASRPVPHESGAELGREMTFRNGSEKTTCLSLHVDGKRLGWVHKAYRMPSELLLWQCVPFADMENEAAGQVEGVADHETVYIIDSTDEAWELKALLVPGFWYMSNESFCGERVAYWAYRNGEHAAVVYDFAKSGILARKSMGSFTIYSNDPEYFPRPEWDDACSNAVFPENYFLKAPVTFNLN